ncbi:Sua5/YciO/YrdC/YwlC family protein [Candidatus Nomurabacteria bacterium]|nr:Sua5/YciO/YrdC/YwlC family protein [Candidatus Nomurabacteria bacterium]
MPDFKDKNLIDCLAKGGVAIMPTDTIYGIVGLALNEKTVERINKIKKRSLGKPFITLIGDWSETRKFGIEASQYKIPENTEPTTYIIKGVSFRFPNVPELRKLLLKTGPLVAPSANPEGLPPAENISQAKEYFGDSIDFYLDGGEISGKASRIIKLNSDGSIDILRN